MRTSSMAPPLPTGATAPKLIHTRSHTRPCTNFNTQLYRAGWSGPYEDILDDTTFADWRHHVWNAAARPALVSRGRSKRWSIQADGPQQ